MALLTKGQRTLWLALIRALNKEAPAAYRVTVKTCSVKDGDAAKCYRIVDEQGGSRFEIHIDPTKCWDCRVDCLRHEYAHALNWAYRHDEVEDPEMHDDGWGACYARVYRICDKVMFGDGTCEPRS